MKKDKYLDMEGISNTALGWIKVSPEYYHWMIQQLSSSTPAMLIGSAMHYLALEPQNFKNYMMILDDSQRPYPTQNYNKTENKDWRNAIYEAAIDKGLEIISMDDYKVAEKMVDKLLSVPEARDLIKAKGVVTEQASTWEWNGMKFKQKRDIDHSDFFADLKSARTADPRQFQKEIFNMDYYRQMGMYSDGERIQKDSAFHKDCFLIAVENTEPYGVSVHKMTDEYLDHGVAEYRKLALLLQDCQKANVWPTYTSKVKGGIEVVQLPKFLKDEE